MQKSITHNALGREVASIFEPSFRKVCIQVTDSLMFKAKIVHAPFSGPLFDCCAVKIPLGIRQAVLAQAFFLRRGRTIVREIFGLGPAIGKGQISGIPNPSRLG
jgi:hypothetical protein